MSCYAPAEYTEQCVTAAEAGVSDPNLRPKLHIQAAEHCHGKAQLQSPARRAARHDAAADPTAATVAATATPVPG